MSEAYRNAVESTNTSENLKPFWKSPKIYIRNNHKTFVMLLYLRNKTTKHKILFRSEEVCKFIQRFVLRYQWNKASKTPCIRNVATKQAPQPPSPSPRPEREAEKLNNKTQLPWCIILRAVLSLITKSIRHFSRALIKAPMLSNFHGEITTRQLSPGNIILECEN